MKVVVDSHYEIYREEIALKLRKGFVDSHKIEILRGECYFCKGNIPGGGVLLVDSYSKKNNIIAVPVHSHCYEHALSGELDGA